MNMPNTLTEAALAIGTADVAARTHRLPWSVTVIKDRKVPGLLCIEMLADSLSTVQEEIRAFAEPCEIKRTLFTGDSDTEKALTEFIRAGIDHVTVTIDIQRQDAQSFGQFLRNLTNCFNSTWGIFVDAVSRPRTAWPNATRIRLCLAKTQTSSDASV